MYTDGFCGMCKTRKKCSVPRCGSFSKTGGMCAYHGLAVEGGACKRCASKPGDQSWVLCRPCYETVRVNGELKTYRKKGLRKAPKPYYNELIEEREFGGLTWSELEAHFGRPKHNLIYTLRKHGRHDLIGEDLER